MGIVYKARDVKLDLLVALKLVSPDLRASTEQVERLFQEARALSRLNHPNVATIYEVDDTAAEPFLAMEHLPGGTLTARIQEAKNDGRPITAKEILRWGQQIGSGLAHAHRHGIIHRDVKPENALLTEDGRIKLTDFGVALVAGHSNDSSGATTEGTVAYMSPEQAQGLEVDQRSDIFSLGVLLFQLVTGDVPYGGQPAAAMIYDIINSPMPSLKPIVADSPAGFERVIRRALEKEPDDRYASIDELLADLQLVRDELRATTGIRPVQAPDPTIVVLPFVDMSPDSDQEYFCDGVSEEIIGALTSVKGLKVVSRTSSFGFKGEAYDIREIGEKLDVQTVLEGSVRKIGERFRITVQHINVSDGYHLWSQRFDREMKDVFAIQDEIAEAVVQALRAKLEKQSAATPAKRTHNVEAYNTYLLGRYHLNQRTHEALNKAIECFE